MLAPVSQPGLVLFPGFTARCLETFFVQVNTSSSTKCHYQVSFASPGSVQGAPLMRIDEEEKKTVVFRQSNGQVAMRVVKQVHKWSGKSPEYHGYAPDGTRLWHLSLKSGLLKTKYVMKLEPGLGSYLPSVKVKNTTSSGDLGIAVDGLLAVNMTKPKILKWRRENVVNVAPGMDILLALGLNWIRYDKQSMDAEAVGEGAGEVGAAESTAASA